MIRCNFVVLVFVLSGSMAAMAQPSGGPYGPIEQSYPVPDSGRVLFVAPDGDANADGRSLERPTTIESAIARVVTGDTVVLRGGTYRTGNLQLNQGITLQPYLDEKPVLKGTRVASDWEALRDNVWRTRWTTLFPARPLGWWRHDREGMRTPLHRFNNDMVFVDGKPLRSAGWAGELDEHSFYIDYDSGHVHLGIDPTNRTVEITAFDIALHRPSRPVHGKESDRKGPTIRGLTFTQYAYRAIDIEGQKPSTTAEEEPTDDPIGLTDPALYGKEVVGTTLEHVTISHCSRVAGYFRGDGLVIRHSLVSDTGTEGIYVIGSSDVLLERNIVRRNNVDRLTGYYPAAVKIFNQSHRVVVRDNLVIEHPDSNGVWYDVGNRDGVFVNNHIEGTQIGFFFEISDRVIAAGNVFYNNEQGIRVLNSANARIHHNTLLNSPVMFDRNERSAQGDHFGWHPATGPDVDERDGHEFVGNLVVADRSLSAPLLHLAQPEALCASLTGSMMRAVDRNTYIQTGASEQPLLIWSPTRGEDCQTGYDTLAAVRSARPEVEATGQTLQLHTGSIFRSVDLRRFDPAPLRPELQAIPVAPDIRAATGWSAPERLPGAHSP